jgi:hypothetical protein
MTMECRALIASATDGTMLTCSFAFDLIELNGDDLRRDRTSAGHDRSPPKMTMLARRARRHGRKKRPAWWITSDASGWQKDDCGKRPGA